MKLCRAISDARVHVVEHPRAVSMLSGAHTRGHTSAVTHKHASNMLLHTHSITSADVPAPVAGLSCCAARRRHHPL
eukprot:scaffold220857_cov19-Tisochrysis_lutea.AAC.1